MRLPIISNNWLIDYSMERVSLADIINLTTDGTLVGVGLEIKKSITALRSGVKFLVTVSIDLLKLLLATRLLQHNARTKRPNCNKSSCYIEINNMHIIMETTKFTCR